MLALIGWSVLVADPIGLSSAMDRASERVIYNIIAPYYENGGFWPAPLRDGAPPIDWNRNITVVLLDDKTLREKDWAWPISLSHHAAILRSLFENFAPTIIMVDLFFVDRRKEDIEGLRELCATLADIQKDGSTQVYLASQPADPNTAPLLPEFRQLAEGGDASAACRPPAARGEDAPDEVAGSVPNPRHRNVTELVSVTWPLPGNLGDGQLYYPLASGAGRESAARRPGAAFTIYRALCTDMTEPIRDAMRCPREPDLAATRRAGGTGTARRRGFATQFQDPMQVVWGVVAPDLNWDQANLGERFNCRKVAKSFFPRLASYILASISGRSDEFPQTCPYTQTIMAREILDQEFLDQDDVRAAYGKALGPASAEGAPKIVFYGVDLAGMRDQVSTYTHGAVPGIYLHAMALNNLLTLGPDYIRYGRDGYIPILTDKFGIELPKWRPRLISLVTAALMAIVAVAVMRLRLSVLAVRLGGKARPRWMTEFVDFCLADPALRILSWLNTVPIIVLAVWISLFYFRLSPINWIGLLGLHGFFLMVSGLVMGRTNAEKLRQMQKTLYDAISDDTARIG